ncbi:MAG: MFS transporter [Anaerolineales bacterium]|nr:MFS transporter [Anaerolineales bacterium]
MINKLDATLPKNWLARFSTIWAGQAFSLFGSMLVQFALVWWLTAQTGSATVLAVATLVALLPTVLIGPIAGAFVDRHSRRWMMVGADSLVALVTLWLVILNAQGWMQVGHVFAAMFLRATAGTFQWPAMQASTSLMVPKKHLARVGGLNQTLYGLLGIVAPPTGALLVMALPMQWVLAIDLITAALAVLPLLAIGVPQPPAPVEKPDEPRKNLLEDMRMGFRYIRAWKGGMMIIAVAVVVKFFLNPAFALLPILAVKHFHGGALEMGWLDAASGIGTVAGGLLLSVWGGFNRRIVTVLVGLVGMGIGMVLVGLTPSGLLAMALAAIAISGMTGSLVDGPIFAIFQSAIDPGMQGRVISVFMSLVSMVVPFGMIFGGLFADRFGVPLLFLIAGIVSLGAAGVSFASPTILSLEQNTPGAMGIPAEASSGETAP